MTWRDRIILLFGAASPFALGHTDAMAAGGLDLAFGAEDVTIDRDAWTYRDPADQQRLLQLAGHRSHSSHSSHRSHSSHYSGSGGGYSAPRYVAPVIPRPVTTPKPKAPVKAPQSSTSSVAMPFLTDSRTTANATATAPVEALTPQVAAPSPQAESTQRLGQLEIADFVRRTQIALMMKGYDPGPADGTLGVKTQAALKAYQTAIALPATGYMDVDTLRRLGVIN